jgi:hypothetical protein
VGEGAVGYDYIYEREKARSNSILGTLWGLLFCFCFLPEVFGSGIEENNFLFPYFSNVNLAVFLCKI